MVSSEGACAAYYAYGRHLTLTSEVRIKKAKGESMHRVGSTLADSVSECGPTDNASAKADRYGSGKMRRDVAQSGLLIME